MSKSKSFSKKAAHIMSQALATLLIVTCSSTAVAPNLVSGGATEISAKGALGRMETSDSGPLYTGDGGRDMRLAILAPESQGDVPAYLPLYIQGFLNNNFSRYSAINLIDRQNLNQIISEQNIAVSGIFSDKDYISIGNLANAQYFLIGTIQRLSGERYSLQFSITESNTGIRKANFMGNGSLAQLEGSGTLINEAAADLLDQMGVKLTEAGRRTLLVGNSSAVRAEAGIARSITDMAGGDEVKALFNITQAIAYDSSNLEALSRLNTLSSSISGGTISQKIVNDIQARNRWLEVFKETASFYKDHPPFEITFDPNLIQIGETDFEKGTANIGMWIVLDPSEAAFTALNALLEGLEKTGRRNAWGFSGWPLQDNITPTKIAGTTVFQGNTSFKYKIDVALLNEKNKNLGNSSITLSTELRKFSAGDTKVQAPAGTIGTVLFPNVRAEDLTPTLTIVIVAVNGVPSGDITNMKIGTGDLEKRNEVQMAQEQENRKAKKAKGQRVLLNVLGGLLTTAGITALFVWLIPSTRTN